MRVLCNWNINHKKDDVLFVAVTRVDIWTLQVAVTTCTVAVTRQS
jgi:hypothetical protein